MSDEKKYSAKDAALAVLAKAQEVYKQHKLSKAEPGTFNAQKEAEAGMQAQMKSEQNVTPPAGVRPTGTPPDNFNGNPAPGAEPKNQGENYKGHIKLAKFVGRMDEKRKAKAAPAAAPGKPAV